MAKTPSWSTLIARLAVLRVKHAEQNKKRPARSRVACVMRLDARSTDATKKKPRRVDRLKRRSVAQIARRKKFKRRRINARRTIARLDERSAGVRARPQKLQPRLQQTKAATTRLDGPQEASAVDLDKLTLLAMMTRNVAEDARLDAPVMLAKLRETKDDEVDDMVSSLPMSMARLASTDAEARSHQQHGRCPVHLLGSRSIRTLLRHPRTARTQMLPLLQTTSRRVAQLVGQSVVKDKKTRLAPSQMTDDADPDATIASARHEQVARKAATKGGSARRHSWTRHREAAGGGS